MTTKINAAMTQDVLRTDITTQLLDANIALRNIGFNNNVPIGCMMVWYSDMPPSGWLMCAGGTESIALYPDLFALWGTEFGGNGTTTFGLPDMSGDAPLALAGTAGSWIVRAINIGK